MISLPHTSKIFLAIMFVLAFGVFGVWWFLYDSVRSFNEETVSFEHEYERERLRQSRLQSLRNLHARTQPFVSEIERVFLHERNIVPFIEQIEQMSRSAGVTHTITSASVSSGENDTHRLDVRLDFRGERENVFRALLGLEMLPYVVHVQRVFLSTEHSSSNPEPGIGDIWRLSVEFSVRSFVASSSER